MPAKRDKTALLYSDLRSAEQALCYTATAFIQGGTDRASLRSAVTRWTKACEGVGKLAFSQPLNHDLVKGGGGGLAFDVAVDSLTSTSSDLKDHNPTTTTKDVTVQKITWLTPFADAWLSQYQGNPNYGLLARTLKPLCDQWGEGEVLERWKLYLKETPGRFASPRRFAETFGEWERRKAGERRAESRRGTDKIAPLPDETPDQYLHRMVNG